MKTVFCLTALWVAGTSGAALLAAEATTRPASQPWPAAFQPANPVPTPLLDEQTTIIAHFGDSTCMTTYLDSKQMVDAVLSVRLKTKYNNANIANVNVAEGGDSIRRFLDAGRCQREVKSRLKRIDIALVRYGMNDMDRRKLEEYTKDLEELCDRLAADFPGVQIILETNMYLPRYPDRFNQRLDATWEVARLVAKQRGYPLVEAYGRMKHEAEAGNKDLCIRNQKLSRQLFGWRIVDDIADAEMAGEANWFNDAHPNYNAIKLIADEEFKLLTKLWPEKLPRAGEMP